MHSTPHFSALYRHLVPPTPSFGFLGLQNLQWKWRNGKGCCMWPMFYPFIPICGWKYFWESFCCLLGKRPISQAVATGWLWGEGEPPLIPELHSAKYAYCIVSMGHCFGNILKIWFPPFLHLLWLQIDKLACLTVIWIHESGDGNAI